MNSTACLVIAVIVAVQFLEVQCDQQCATRELSRACYTAKDRTSCLKSTESRHVVANGVQIFGTECVWCPSGPCTGNNKNQCEPKNWLEAQHINGFEICGKNGPTTCFDVGLTTKKWGYEISWSVGNFCTSNRRYGSHASFTQQCCFNGGTHDIMVTCTDSYGDGWNGGYLEINGQRYCDYFTWGKQYREHLTLGAAPVYQHAPAEFPVAAAPMPVAPAAPAEFPVAAAPMPVPEEVVNYIIESPEEESAAGVGLSTTTPPTAPPTSPSTGTIATSAYPVEGGFNPVPAGFSPIPATSPPAEPAPAS